MYPHERSLVEKNKDRPFAIVGINSDDNREKLKETITKETITWRSFWDGGSPSGPIANKWGVEGWPTVYLIDHEGVILGQVGGPKMDEMIETAINAAEAANKK